MKPDQLTLEQINKYSRNKNVFFLSAIIISIIGIATVCLLTFLEGIGILKNNHGLIGSIIYIVALIFLLIETSYYEKVRIKLIKKVDTKTFKLFFDYFLTFQNQKRGVVYFEVKDIFLYGLWNLKDEDPYLKFISETDSIEFEVGQIKDKVNKKQFLASSMFRCLTFHKDGVIYRNQHIFLDQNKFIQIIKEYSKIFFNQMYHTEEFIRECQKVEQKYFKDKEYAIDHYEGLAKDISQKERFVNFSNNAKLVKDIKKILAIFAIIAVFVQNINETTNVMVTIFFEGITIVLLLVDITQRNDDKTLH